ncbi:hypothetical protein GN956_G23291 [Arapaima gigas]
MSPVYPTSRGPSHQHSSAPILPHKDLPTIAVFCLQHSFYTTPSDWSRCPAPVASQCKLAPGVPVSKSGLKEWRGVEQQQLAAMKHSSLMPLKGEVL